MAYIDFISQVHKSTKRDYLKRVNDYPKAEAAEKAKKWGEQGRARVKREFSVEQMVYRYLALYSARS